MINVKVNDENNSDSEFNFPCLLENKFHKLIILATSPGCGTILVGTDMFPVGVYKQTWSFHKKENVNWKSFNGSLELYNDKV